VVSVQIRYDPFDASILNDPYPTYRLLRDAAPVYRAEESHTWVLSRHADVQAAALDHSTYPSVDAIFARMSSVGADDAGRDKVRRAMENVKTALRLRLARGASDAEAAAVAAVLDEAAGKIERL